MEFADLKLRHRGQRVLICGTGPSLDDLDDVRGPRILIHRAAFTVPRSRDETYWLVLDDCWGMETPGPWDQTLDDLRAGRGDMVGLFRNPLGAVKVRVPAPTGPNIITWDGSRPQNSDVLALTRDELVDRRVLYTWCGSAGPAVHLAWLMGASKILLAGIDGTDGHAEQLTGYYEKMRRGGFGYAPSKQKSGVCSVPVV